MMVAKVKTAGTPHFHSYKMWAAWKWTLQPRLEKRQNANQTIICQVTKMSQFSGSLSRKKNVVTTTKAMKVNPISFLQWCCDFKRIPNWNKPGTAPNSARTCSQKGIIRQILGSMDKQRCICKLSRSAWVYCCLNSAAIAEVNHDYCGNSEKSCHDDPADASNSSWIFIICEDSESCFIIVCNRFH